MIPLPETFEFDYFDSDIVYGRGCVDRLGTYLDDADLENALLVCGTNVGANDDLMEPIREALGDRLGGEFPETTPAKTAETVYDGIDAMNEAEADVLIGVGGGSSLDIARQISAFAADGRSLSEFRQEVREGRLEAPDAGTDPTPVIVIPTTLAGADISDTGAMAIFMADESPTGETVRTYGSVMPIGMFYDPRLFETSPAGPLRGSAMNGFDKPLETLYARNGDPIIHSTAMHSLRLFRESLPKIPDDPEAMDRAVVGIILAQFRRRISAIHAFGHGVSRHYPVHQGEVHAILAPHVLRYLFEHVDANRRLLAEGFGLDAESLSGEELEEAIIAEVIAVRNGLGLPSRLRDLGDVPEHALGDIAEYTLQDGKMEQVPAGLDPTAEELENVLRAAW